MTHRRRILSVRTLRIRNKTHFKMFCMLTQLLRDTSFPVLEFKKKTKTCERIPKAKGTFSRAESYFVILVDYPASHANKLQRKKKKKSV